MSRSSSEKETIAESRDDGVNAGSSTTSEIERVVIAKRGDGVNAGSSEVAGESRNDDDKTKYIPLYRALVKADLKSTKAYLDKHPEVISAKISTIGETPLHIAVSHGHHKLAMDLISRIGGDEEKLSKKDDYDETPLHIAARGANTLIAQSLMGLGLGLMGLGDADGQVPLTLAAIYGNRNMLSTLVVDRWFCTNDYLKIENWTLFNELILSERFGVALNVWGNEQPESMTFKDEDLYRMAEMVAVFSSANQFTNYERWIYKCPVALYDCLDYTTACPILLGPPHSIFEGFKYIYSTVLRFLKGLMFCILIIPALIGVAVRIILKLEMKQENENAYKLLSYMCSPKWTFDSKHVGVYFEAIKRAIKCGNVEFVEEVLRSNPALLWGNKESGTIFHIALAFRQEKIWNLIYGLSVAQRNKIIGILVERNNMLHIAACPIITAKTIGVPDEASKMLQQGVPNEASKMLQQEEHQFWKVFSKAPGAAMKVQRELQWYKEVEGMVPSSYRIRPNSNGETPHALFTTWHSKLVKEGEQWMRDTATSCTIVATLIVTVMFAAAFTLPGGNYDQSENSENFKSAHAGNPRFLWRNSFMIFVISDALSLFSSVTAVLMFLSILTSRFEEKDFLKALPMRLIIGLATLFLSIASMMVTFGVTLVIVFSERIRWTVVPVTVLASFPVTLFALLQFPLFVDMASSTYGGIFNRKKKCSFFNNPNDYIPEKKTNNNVDDPAKKSEV